MHDIVMNILSVETTEFANKGAINCQVTNIDIIK